MKEHVTPADITDELKSAVNAYLMARAYAETMRSSIDEIQRAILEECPLTNGLEIEHGEPPRAITEPKHTYLCTDEAQLEDYYAECDKREREAGLKPETMEKDYCPALVARSMQSNTERLVIECGMRMLGIDDIRITAIYGEKRRRFIDLLVRLVVNMPDFKNPMTGKAA